MPADICPSTKLRCHNLQGCQFTSCHYWNGYAPISERSLTQAELYKLAIAEQKAAQR